MKHFPIRGRCRYGALAARGFTLVEVMLSIAILAVIGGMSWLGLDVLLRSRNQVEQHMQLQSRWQVALGQWQVDLDQAISLPGVEPMGWDGKVFRLTRRSAQAGADPVVVAWSILSLDGNTYWMRWQSPAVHSVGLWQEAWEQAGLWGRSAGVGDAVVLVPADRMDIYEWSGVGWVNGQSARASEQQADGQGRGGVFRRKRVVPKESEGVRILLATPQGTVRKDWVSSTFSGAKS